MVCLVYLIASCCVAQTRLNLTIKCSIPKAKKSKEFFTQSVRSLVLEGVLHADRVVAVPAMYGFEVMIEWISSIIKASDLLLIRFRMKFLIKKWVTSPFFWQGSP